MKSPLKPRPKGPGELPGKGVCPVSHGRQGRKILLFTCAEFKSAIVRVIRGEHREGKHSGFQFITKSKIPANWQRTKSVHVTSAL